VQESKGSTFHLKWRLPLRFDSFCSHLCFVLFCLSVWPLHADYWWSKVFIFCNAFLKETLHLKYWILHNMQTKDVSACPQISESSQYLSDFQESVPQFAKESWLLPEWSFININISVKLQFHNYASPRQAPNRTLQMKFVNFTRKSQKRKYVGCAEGKCI